MPKKAAVQSQAEAANEVLDAPAQLIEYNAINAGLAELGNQLKGVVFDVSTTAGDKAARAARAQCVSIRTNTDAAYELWNKPMLDKQRRMRAERDRIKGVVLELETPIDEQIKAGERKKDEERQAKAQAEAKRVADIQERIAGIHQLALDGAMKCKTAVDAAALIDILNATDITLEAFEEFIEVARAAKVKVLAALQEIHARLEGDEAEAAQIAADRAELAKIRAELAARKKAEADAAAAAQAEADKLAAQAQQEADPRQLAIPVEEAPQQILAPRLPDIRIVPAVDAAPAAGGDMLDKAYTVFVTVRVHNEVAANWLWAQKDSGEIINGISIEAIE